MRLYTHSYTERLSRYRADPGSCNACPLKPECTPGDSGRVLMRSFDEELLQSVRSYRQTEPYEKALRKRKVWVEPMFAEAKDWLGVRRFRLRGLEKVNVEALLIASGQNIKRLVAARDGGPRKLAQAAALRPADPVSRCRPHLTGRRPFDSRTGRISTGCCILTKRRFAMGFTPSQIPSRSPSSPPHAAVLMAG